MPLNADKESPFIVSYHASGFPDGMLQRNGEIRFYESELVHAVFTVGRAPGDQLSYGEASVWEFLHRTSLVRAYIRQDYDSHFVLSRLASELDRSEKTAVSYVIGQAMTSIFSRKELSVDYLMHVDRYGSRWGIQFGSKKRSDLFGYGRLGWVVAEAKGRSSSPDDRLRANLQAQKSSVVSIQGKPPDLAMGCVSYFSYEAPFWSRSSTSSGAPWLKLEVFDPAPEVEPVSVEFDMDRYILAYYEPFISMLDTDQADEVAGLVEDERYVSVRFENLQMRVGLLRSILEILRRAKAQGDLAGLSESVFRVLGESRTNTTFTDGSLFEVDWQNSIHFHDWLG
jgi:hypothetical protein